MTLELLSKAMVVENRPDGRSSSGDVKGTITDAVRYHFVSNDVRRHRLISIGYISLLPCHGRGRGVESRRPRHSFQALAGKRSPFLFLLCRSLCRKPVVLTPESSER